MKSFGYVVLIYWFMGAFSRTRFQVYMFALTLKKVAVLQQNWAQHVKKYTQSSSV